MFAFANKLPVSAGLLSITLAYVRRGLMVIGLLALLGSMAFFLDAAWVSEPVRASVARILTAESETLSDAGESASSGEESLSPPMAGALRYVAKRYRVSMAALQPVFASAEETGKEIGLDPLLIIAVIGVESSFNPFSQSVMGAQGLMQVVPRFHLDKLPETAGDLPLIDPVTNVQVGARVLKESIRRSGGLTNGLQQFGGARDDPERRYATKVLAEWQRLKSAAGASLAAAASSQGGKSS